MTLYIGLTRLERVRPCIQCQATKLAVYFTTVPIYFLVVLFYLLREVNMGNFHAVATLYCDRHCTIDKTIKLPPVTRE